MNKYIILLLLLSAFLSCSSKDTVPIYDYYKNIPIIRGWTQDETQKSYIIEVVLVYRENNSDLQTKINLLKPLLIDGLRGYFSSLYEKDFISENQDNVKYNAVLLLNEIILKSMTPKKVDKLHKIESLEELDLLLDIDILQLQVFNLN